MDPVTMLSMADGLITLVGLAAKEISQLVKSGQISPEEQQVRLDKIETIRKAMQSGKFEGPEWEVVP